MRDLKDVPTVRHIITSDGSSTLFSPVFDQHYHSIHGAIQESMHVFLRSGLEALPEEKQNIRIFEMGFGTGLNALLTCLHKQIVRFTILLLRRFLFPQSKPATLTIPRSSLKRLPTNFLLISMLPPGDLLKALSPDLLWKSCNWSFLLFSPRKVLT